MDHLERTREDLRRASDTASGEMQVQLDSIVDGIGEENEEGATQDEPGPKVDRIVEVRDKLGGLEERAEAGETIERIGDARENASATPGRTHRRRPGPPPRVRDRTPGWLVT